MNILVTGATGRIGSHLVHQLLSEGHHVRALTRHPDQAQLPKDVEVVQGDLTDTDSLRRPLRLLAPAEAQSRHGPVSEPCLHLVLTVERRREMTPALPVRERILRSSQDVPRLSAGQGR